MKIQKGLLGSLLALALGLLVALIVGSFIGWAENPAKANAEQAAVEKLAREGAYGSMEEMNKILQEKYQRDPRSKSPEPHAIVAILQWHPFLLGLFSLCFLLIFRPRMLPVSVVFIPAIVLVFSMVSGASAIVLFLALGSYIGLYSFTPIRGGVNAT